MPEMNPAAIVAGAVGAVIACIVDLAGQNPESSVRKVSAAVHEIAPVLPGSGVVSIVVIGLLGAYLCRVLSATTEREAFFFGLSVFSIFSAGSAYLDTPSEQFPRSTRRPANERPAPTTPQKKSTLSLSLAYAEQPVVAQGGLPTAGSWKDANATVLDNPWISDCQPDAKGFFQSLNSFFNNIIYICETEGRIPSNERVRIIGIKDTAIRGYRYVEVQFRDKSGRIRKGWVPAGRSPDGWTLVRPDDPSAPVVKPVEQEKSLPIAPPGPKPQP